MSLEYSLQGVLLWAGCVPVKVAIHEVKTASVCKNCMERFCLLFALALCMRSGDFTCLHRGLLSLGGFSLTFTLVINDNGCVPYVY